MTSTSLIRFAELCLLAEARIQARYGVGVVTRDIPDAFIGDLDGAEIHIDRSVTSEQRLFLLLHLFGHTVQWNVDEDAFALGQTRRPPVDEALVSGIISYEQEAASYGMALLHETGVLDADEWLADFSARDLAYLVHFYRTGQKLHGGTALRLDLPALHARAIPAFVPVRRILRSSGVVI